MLNDLIWVLEKSVEKNGEIKLTNKHLLNIAKMIKRKQINDDFNGDLIEASVEIDSCGDR